MLLILVFFNDTATTEIYTLSLHDALPICAGRPYQGPGIAAERASRREYGLVFGGGLARPAAALAVVSILELCLLRSEEHTSELQSRQYLVCRLLLEKKKKSNRNTKHTALT